MTSREGHYCTCRNGKEDECVIGYINGERENKYETYEAVREIPGKLFPILHPRTEPITLKEMNAISTECDMYYILAFDDKGARLRQREAFLPTSNIDDFAVDCKGCSFIKVLHLFKKSTGGNHGFVAILHATGFGNFYIVIDKASTAKNNNPDRSSSVHFGFILPCEGAIYYESRAVAIKHKPLRPGFGVNYRREIRLALKAGGEYNMKYEGSTAIESSSEIWIAMELCCKDTFDDLVKRRGKFGYIIGAKEMKVSFRHILRGLEHLHAEDIIHGEMIASNVLLSLDRKRLKVGNYDQVRNVGGWVKFTYKDDINKTAVMFYNCLTRFKADGNFKRFAEKMMESTTGGGRDIQLMREFVGFGGNYYPHVWAEMLRKITRKVIIYKGWKSLAAYLIMSMILERTTPTAMEVLNHPFFWDEFKILQFIGRADALFRNQNRPGVMSIIEEFRSSCGILFGEINWYAEMDRHGVLKKIPTKHANKHLIATGWDHSDMRQLLRVIRNCHQHQQDRIPGRKFFKSSYEVWQSFNSMYPGMICLLHRAIWKRRKSLWMTKEIKSFFNERDGNYDLTIPE